MNQGVIIVIDRCEILKSFFEYADYETLLTDPLKTKAILLDLKMPSKDISLINGIITSNPNLFRIRIFRVNDRNKIDISSIVNELVKDSYFTRESIEQFVKDLINVLYPIVTDKKDGSTITPEIRQFIIDRITTLNQMVLEDRYYHNVPLNQKDVYRKAARGDIDSQLFIANSFYAGENGFSQSFLTAYEWYEKIADANNICVKKTNCIRSSDSLKKSEISSKVSNNDDSISNKNTFDLEKHVINRLMAISKSKIDYSENPDVPSRHMSKYTKAISGDIDSQLFIADSFFTGENGFKKSFSSALRWYKRIASENNISISNISFPDPNIPSFLSGRGMDIYKKAMQGSSDEQYQVGYNYCYGKNGYPRSYPDALKWYNKSASQNNAKALEGLGIMYDYGWGVEQSDKTAVEYYEKALSIDLTLSVAGSNLGNKYYYGAGVSVDYSKAKYYYEIGSKNGDSYAMNGLGLMYEYGHGVFQSYETAKEWYSKAADLGNRCAICNLGILYDYGRGMSRRNRKKAVQLYRQSADLGYSHAQYLMGRSYEEGSGGLPKSITEAIKWYELAASNNHSYACYRIGKIYELGSGVFKNTDKARVYYKKAAALGNTAAQSCLDSL